LIHKTHWAPERLALGAGTEEKDKVTRISMNVLTLFIAACLVALCGTAQAQDKQVENAAKVDSASAEAAGEAVNSTSAKKLVIEKDLAKFWGQRREVKVVQRRLYNKDSRFEASLFGGVIPNDDFIVYFPTGVRAAYHLTEGFSAELSYALAIDNQSDLSSFLTSEGIDLKRADIQEFVDMYYGVNILWAPIYGKISILGLKLSHFDAYVGVGFGLFHTREIPPDNPDGNDKIKPSGNTIFGFRWFITDTFNIRTEYRQHFFQKFQGGVSIPVELTLGLGITI
jgi:outer membrane beta-barrel protein